jgi:hypothetical protein
MIELPCPKGGNHDFTLFDSDGGTFCQKCLMEQPWYGWAKGVSVMDDERILVSDSHGQMSRTDVSVRDLESLSKKIDIILQAISISHIKQPGTDKCVENCWACKMEESLKAMDVADRMKE